MIGEFNEWCERCGAFTRWDAVPGSVDQDWDAHGGEVSLDEVCSKCGARVRRTMYYELTEVDREDD